MSMLSVAYEDFMLRPEPQWGRGIKSLINVAIHIAGNLTLDSPVLISFLRE